MEKEKTVDSLSLRESYCQNIFKKHGHRSMQPKYLFLIANPAFPYLISHKKKPLFCLMQKTFLCSHISFVHTPFADCTQFPETSIILAL